MSPFFRITAALVFLAFSLLSPPQSQLQAGDVLDDPLVKGKSLLDRGDPQGAVSLLTAALQTHPSLNDYALFWRSLAYEAQGEYANALADLAELRTRHRDSLLLKRARKKEAEITRVFRPASALDTLKDYVRDYPADLDMKLKYADLLKDAGRSAEAKHFYKDVYLSPSALSEKARAALTPDDITQADLLKRGQNLNNAWMFRESEMVLREALSRGGPELRGKIRDALAYSLFRQKRYAEAAELYGQSGNTYWRARALLRAGQIKTFEDEIDRIRRSKDSRIASVLINYASRKRRDGADSDAIKTLSDVITRHPASREEALWTLGWTHYRAGRYEEAAEVFSRLSSQHKDTKYMYWTLRCLKKQGRSAGSNSATVKKLSVRDYYYYIAMVQGDAKDAALRKVSGQSIPTQPLGERIDLLRKLGFRAEAAEEIRNVAQQVARPTDLIALAAALHELGEYHTSVGLVAKAPYSENLHALYYPRGYWAEIQEAARIYSLEPALIAAVIREESRFDRRARSIAGALGLMQLMPDTARKISRLTDLPMKETDDLFQPRTNILLGALYLHHLVETFGSLAPAIAAYNAGEDVVREWLRKGDYEDVDEFIEDIPYDETRNYVKKVLVSFFEYLRSAEGADFPRVRRLVGEL